MPYEFAVEDEDYTHYAAGRVLYSLPGSPAFPVRLASEILQRARRLLGLERRLVMYDPACGGAYHLCAVGFLHGAWIDAILASDADEQALALARRNLGLLSSAGLEQRQIEIEDMLVRFGKASHAEALRSVQVLKQQLERNGRPIRVHTFQANALEPGGPQQAHAAGPVDLVISDVPYGQLSAWQPPAGEPAGNQPPLWRMLDTLLPGLLPTTLVAIAADKRQKIAHPGYRRADRFILGKRQVAFLFPS